LAPIPTLARPRRPFTLSTSAACKVKVDSDRQTDRVCVWLRDREREERERQPETERAPPIHAINFGNLQGSPRLEL